MIDVNLDGMDQHEMWITATEALKRLGTKPQTLYANVSRGRIRAKADPADERRSLYAADDVDRLASRAVGRRPAETVAADAIRWGDPVLDTSISTISGGRLLYRGRDAVELAETATLEAVAALLWGAEPVLPTAAATGTPSIAMALVALATEAGSAAPTYGRTQAVLRVEAGTVLATMAAALCGGGEGPLHLRLARRWQAPTAADALRRAFVLCADHELNASTFAARVVVSTGASLAGGTLAALAALTGPLHGGAGAAVLALVRAAEQQGPEAAVRSWLASGRHVPAVGHRLYSEGDPRGVALLAAIDVPPLYAELAEVIETLVGEQPNVDFALAALCGAYGLPAEAPMTIFALGRTVGWLAHMLEQAASGALVRPRARYVGEIGA